MRIDEGVKVVTGTPAQVQAKLARLTAEREAAFKASKEEGKPAGP